MPTYEVTLKSQTDDNRRTVRLDADDEAGAKERCRELEAEYVLYSLDDDPDVDADALLGALSVGDDGKVSGGAARDRIRLHMHHQDQPYKITSVKEV